MNIYRLLPTVSAFFSALIISFHANASFVGYDLLTLVNGYVFEIDPDTGNTHRPFGIGTTGSINSARSLAYDANRKYLYVTDYVGGLYKLDLFGIHSGVAVTHFGGSYEGLAFDPGRDRLYATQGYHLFSYDGYSHEQVGILPLTNISHLRGLAYDPFSDLLYAVDGQTFNNSLWIIDLITGVGSFIGFTGVSAMDGITFHPEHNALYGTDNSHIYSVDTTTGEATLINEYYGMGYPIQVNALTSIYDVGSPVPEPPALPLFILALFALIRFGRIA